MISLKRHYWRIWRLAPLILAVIVAGFGGLRWLDQPIYDAHLRITPATATPSNVVIVAVDDMSLRKLGRWPWPRDLQARLLDRMTEAGVRAVGMDILLTEPSSPEADQRLAEAMTRNGRVILPVGFARLEDNGQMIELLPHPVFAQAAAALGHSMVSYDVDGLVRHAWLKAGLNSASWPHFALETLRIGMPQFGLPSFRVALAEQGSLWMLYKQNRIGMDYSVLKTPVTTLSASDVLEGLERPRLRGQIVLFGVTAQGITPQLPTPVAGDEHAMSGLALHAAILRDLASHRFISGLGVAGNLFVAATFMLLWSAVTPGIIRRHTLMTHLAGLFAGVGLSLTLLALLQVWLPPSPILAGLALSYLISSTRRTSPGEA